MKDRVVEREKRKGEALRKKREDRGELKMGNMNRRGVEEEEKTVENEKAK